MPALPLFRRRSDLLVLTIDLLCVLLVARVAYGLRFEGQPTVPGEFVDAYRWATVLLVPTWILLARSSGLYRRAALRPGTSNLAPATTAASLAGLALLVVSPVLLEGRISRAWIGLVVLGLAVAGVGSRAVIRGSRRALVPLGLALERYGVVGDDEAGRRLTADLTRASGAPFRVVAEIPADLGVDALVDRVHELRLDGLVYPPGGAEQAAPLAARLAGQGVDVLVAPHYGELEMRVASIAMLQGVPLLRIAGMAPRRRAIRVRARDRARAGVAVLGTRGIPANYGGFETFAEQLSLRLVQGGVATTVYGRSHYVDASSPWNGIRLVVLPTIRSKYLDTVVHTALSALHLVLTRGPKDVVLCNAANAPVLLLLRLFRRRVVLNVDGLEWRRSKWGIAGRCWYRMGEWLSVRLASVLVTDANEVQTYYRVRHDADSVMIPYGADLLIRGSIPVPEQTPVEPDRYALYVSRWESENNPLLVARAHASSGADLDLVMLGQATYDEALEQDVRAAISARGHAPGPVFGDGYRGLQANAACYVHATEVGGTHPALIEAMGAGNLILVLDTPENREVVGDAGVFFSDEPSLSALLTWAGSLSPAERQQWRQRARDRAQATYSWDAVTAAYRELLGA